MLPWYIVGGEMDRVLLYPVRSLLFVLMARPELHALGNLGLGVALLSASFHQLSLPGVALLMVPLWVVSGMLIYTAALVAMGCLCFRIVGHWATHFMFVHHLLHTARYPISIYPRWLQVVLLSVFPIGVATFVPGRWLFGQTSLWVWVAFRLWDGALKYYQSTGS
jgi:ABC-2 type transport system permease protein